MLRHRLITAAILIPLTVWGVLYLGTAQFAALIAVPVLLGAWEWTALSGLAAGARAASIACCAALLGLAYVYVIENVALYALLTGVVVSWTAGLMWILAYNRRPRVVQGGTAGMRAGYGAGRYGLAAVGALVLVPAWAALIALHGGAVRGPGLVLFLFVLVWATDIGGFFAGRRWGGAKLIRNVSPGKTWAGVAGGLILAAAAAGAAAAIFHLGPRDGGLFALIALAAACYSIVGDLMKSMYKRRLGVKDSGRLLPGHGGILDRIDSMTAAAPVFVAGLYWAGIPT